MSFVNFIKTSLYGTPPGHCFWSMNKIIWIKKPCRKFPEQWNQRLRSRRSLRPATLLKKGLWHRCFPVNFVKFLRTPFFTDYLWMTAFTNLNTIYRDVLKFWDMMAIIRWISLQFQLTINQYHVNQQLVYTVKKAALKNLSLEPCLFSVAGVS